MYSYIYFDLTHMFYSIPERNFRKKLILKKKNQQTPNNPQNYPACKEFSAHNIYFDGEMLK